MKLIGKIYEIGKIQQVSENFRKRIFIIEYVENNPQYPEYLSFELTKEKCNLIDNFSINQIVEISFNLKGRKWTDRNGDIKYFTSMTVWKIEAIDENNNKSINENSDYDQEDEVPW
jgi:hypothetical protein